MKISQINIFPIKSLRGIALTKAVVKPTGLEYDRGWMLADREGRFLSQREFPKMAVIEVELDGNGLLVSAEHFGSQSIPFEPDSAELIDVEVWNSRFRALGYLGPMNEWFSDVLGKNCRLIKMPTISPRLVNPKFNSGDDTVSFADGYPLMVIGQASLDDLNARLQERYREKDNGDLFPLPMDRFRPNIVVDDSAPFAEDHWARIRVGEATFRVVKPCARCVITTIDQSTGESTGKEPLKTLANFRLARDVFPNSFEAFGLSGTAVVFGENLIPENDGMAILIGDQITVIDRRDRI